MVDQRNPAASDSGPGTEAAPFRSISAAASKASAGDTVLVHGGVYRERVAPARGGASGKPIVYAAAPGARPVVRGSEMTAASDWKKVGVAYELVLLCANLTAKFETINGGVFDPYAIRLAWPGNESVIPSNGSAACTFDSTLGQVFQKGELLKEVANASAADLLPMTWSAAENGTVIRARFRDATAAPEDVEVTVRQRVFAPHVRGLGYISIKGFVFEHAAVQWDDGFCERTSAFS